MAKVIFTAEQLESVYGKPTGPQAPSGAQAKQPVEKEKNIVEKAGAFLGMDKLAQGVGQTISNIAGGQRGVIESQNDAIGIEDKLLAQIKADKALGKDTSQLEKSLGYTKETIDNVGKVVEDVGTGGLSDREVIGSAVQTAANFIPGAAKGASLAGKVATGAATGYAFDVGGGLQNEDKTIGQAFTPGVGTVVGAALPMAGKLLSPVQKAIEKLPERLVQSATGQSKKALLAGQDVSKYVIDKKRVGTASGLIKKSSEEIDRLSDEIGANLKGSTVTMAPSEIFEKVAKLPEADNALLAADDVKEIVTSLAPQTKKLLQKETLTLEEANKLRQVVDQALGDRVFLNQQTNVNKVLLKDFSHTLREYVKTQAPEGTRGMFSDLANEIRLRNALSEKIAKKAGNQILSFGDLLGAGTGAFIPGVGPVTGAIARRAIQSTPVMTGAAVAGNVAGKVLRPTAKTTSKIGKKVIQNTAANSRKD